MINPLIQLQEFGQSPWYDYIAGVSSIRELKAMIENDRLSASPPTRRYSKAIGGSTTTTTRSSQSPPMYRDQGDFETLRFGHQDAAISCVRFTRRPKHATAMLA